MRLPRFTTRRLILTVAAVALFLAFAVWMHPQPVLVRILLDVDSETHEMEGYEIIWSDGSETKVGANASIPRCNGGEPFALGFLRRVEWYDETWSRCTSYTWHTSWPTEPIPKPPPGPNYPSRP
jgi:hypothetical protein